MNIPEETKAELEQAIGENEDYIRDVLNASGIADDPSPSVLIAAAYRHPEILSALGDVEMENATGKRRSLRDILNGVIDAGAKALEVAKGLKGATEAADKKSQDSEEPAETKKSVLPLPVIIGLALLLVLTTALIVVRIAKHKKGGAS